MTDHELPKPSERDKNLNSENDHSEQAEEGSTTRWQRIKGHRYFKPALAIGGLVTIGGISFFAAKSPEAREAAKDLFIDGLSEIVHESGNVTSEASKRKSPAGHTVSSHERRQHFGPGRTETKTVPIPSYPRGG
ncbi:hypothetical protein JOF48_000841 [Arthrobacter stackebrandtii]|uniref:YtxH domain-containing protein n=1 Tax=Arthrobacter stackebrandtii TaxID=272161 RepID=A0ABS4YTB3_9MICC|nr:hypothetical protein [Arthrobacter stackebrandtii]MBP2412042.1 hypothetical protein [Arthrobacter stackebrandtii]